MKNYKYIKTLFYLTLVTFVFTSCEDEYTESSLNSFVGFEISAAAMDVTIVNNSTQSYDINVYASEVASSDRTFEIAVDTEATTLDASNYTVPSQVTIPANSNEGVLNYSLTDNDNLGFVTQTLSFGLVSQSGVNVSDNNIVVNAIELCELSIVSLALDFDDFAEEAYWEIYDLSGTPTVIESGGQDGAYGDLDNTSLSFDFCMGSGSYGVVVYDSYGDGGTDFTLSVDGVTQASGSTPDAGGGYPVLTSVSGQFTIN